MDDQKKRSTMQIVGETFSGMIVEPMGKFAQDAIKGRPLRGATKAFLKKDENAAKLAIKTYQEAMYEVKHKNESVNTRIRENHTQISGLQIRQQEVQEKIEQTADYKERKYLFEESQENMAKIDQLEKEKIRLLEEKIGVHDVIRGINQAGKELLPDVEGSSMPRVDKEAFRIELEKDQTFIYRDKGDNLSVETRLLMNKIEKNDGKPENDAMFSTTSPDRSRHQDSSPTVPQDTSQTGAMGIRAGEGESGMDAYDCYMAKYRAEKEMAEHREGIKGRIARGRAEEEAHWRTFEAPHLQAGDRERFLKREGIRLSEAGAGGTPSVQPQAGRVTVNRQGASAGGDVRVKAYTKSDGTQVRAHTRERPED